MNALLVRKLWCYHCNRFVNLSTSEKYLSSSEMISKKCPVCRGLNTIVSMNVMPGLEGCLFIVDEREEP